MKHIPDGSIDMVLCDLPYGTIQGLKLKGWTQDTAKWDVQIDTDKLFTEYERILRQNGIIVLFSNEPYTSKLRTWKQSNIEFAYPLIWDKCHFANPLSVKKAPVSYYEDMSVFYKRYDTQFLNPLRQYFKQVMSHIGIDAKKINKILGHRKAEHCFYIDSTQFALCTKATYQELIDTFHIDKMQGFKSYEQLVDIAKAYKRRFNIPEKEKFVGNIFKFTKDYSGLHPTQKPVALLERLISIYTDIDEVILDNCMGSGSTGVAALNLHRKFIGIELYENYFNIAKNRIENTVNQ